MSVGVLEPRVPVGAATLGRQVEDGPERHRGGRAARVLARVGALGPHLGAPEVPDRSIPAREDVERRVVVAAGHFVGIVAVEGAAGRSACVAKVTLNLAGIQY